MSAHANLRQRTIRSLFWQLLGVGGQRLVQLASFAALGRLLELPEIGLFVVLLTGIGVIEALTMFVGEQTTISSRRTIDNRYLDTVFTVRLLRGLAISSVLCGLSWPLAWFFADPTSTHNHWLPGLFLALAPNGVIDALQSPARAAHMKGLEFRRIVLGDFTAAVLGAALTVGLAWLWGDVWALLVGHLATTTVRSAVSYWSAPHLPRFCLDRPVLKELLHYNIAAAGAPFLLLLIFTSPALVLGKVLGDKGALAIYDFAGRLAKLPEDVFLRVLAPVAIPAYAQLRDDAAALRRAWLRAMHSFLVIGAPMTVAMAWCGDTLPAVAFGAAYGSQPGLFALLSLYGGLAGMTAVIGPLFWAVGRPRLDRDTQFVRCVVVYVLGSLLALRHGVLGFAVASCVSIGTALVMSAVLAQRLLQVTVGELLAAMRAGAAIGGGLFAALGLVDLLIAPTHLWRVAAACSLAGPLLIILTLRLMRERRDLPPADVPGTGAPPPLAEQPGEPSLP